MPAGRRLALAVLCGLSLGLADIAGAQPREGLGGWALDVRGTAAGLPSTAGWVPTLATGSIVPGRGYGLDGALDVFLGPGRYRRLSVGARGVAAQGRATSVKTQVEVTTRLVAAAPQIAMNFGHRQGWSYLSLGAGSARVTSNAPGTADDPAGRSLVIHYGGGARWFVSSHLAVSVDLRFWALTPRAANEIRQKAAAATKVAVSAGLALR